MLTGDNIERARQCYAAFANQDRELIELLLADDLRFTSPYDDHIDRDEYFRRCWPGAGVILGHDILSIAQDGDAVLVVYDCRTEDGNTFRNAERLVFKNGRISEVEVYFGDPPREIQREDFLDVIERGRSN